MLPVSVFVFLPLWLSWCVSTVPDQPPVSLLLNVPSVTTIRLQRPPRITRYIRPSSQLQTASDHHQQWTSAFGFFTHMIVWCSRRFRSAKVFLQCTDFLKGRDEKKDTLACVLAPNRAFYHVLTSQGGSLVCFANQEGTLACFFGSQAGTLARVPPHPLCTSLVLTTMSG